MVPLRDNNYDDNFSRILEIILTDEPVTKVELVRATGLDDDEVSLIIDKLLQDGLVHESSVHRTTDKAASSELGGLYFNKESFCYGLIRPSDKLVFVHLFDLHGSEIFRETFQAENESPDKLLAEYSHTVRSMADRSNLRFLGVNLIAPCPVNSLDGIIYLYRPLGWRNVPAGEIIGNNLNAPVFVQNDARAGALAELYFGTVAGKNDNFIFLSTLNGIRCGIVAGGNLYHGAHGIVGEFGLCVVPQGDQDGEEIKNTDILKSFASDIGLIQNYAEISGHDTPDVSVDEILRLAVDPESQARQALVQTINALGAVIMNIDRPLNPEKIILGGWTAKKWAVVGPIIADQLDRMSNLPGRKNYGKLLAPSTFPENYTMEGARAMTIHHAILKKGSRG